MIWPEFMKTALVRRPLVMSILQPNLTPGPVSKMRTAPRQPRLRRSADSPPVNSGAPGVNRELKGRQALFFVLTGEG
jgi:hypothetical protein